MKILVARTYKTSLGKIFLGLLLVIAMAGCDEMGKVASGVGTATKNLADKVTGNEPNQQASGQIGQGEDDQNVVVAEGEKADDNAAVSATDPDPAEDPEIDVAQIEDPSNGRNIEQYPRLPRNVTWKPISSSAGDNLTVVLWGAGGGEKNYEEGSLHIEHNEGIKYPRKYVRRDDPTNGERAPKFHFDVQGSWFVGKDPVLFWNLGAYRVIHPDRRQGKHEE